MNNSNTNATELANLLRKFNKGVRGVEIQYGIVEVDVTSKSAAAGVSLDLLRSRAFKSVNTVKNARDGGFLVHAIPA